MALSDIVNVSITTVSAKAQRAGFGVPLILAADTPVGFTERVRTYSDLSGLVADFATSTATYQMAARLLSQDPRPPQFMVGRLANLPTQRWAVTPVVTNSTVYKMTIDGNVVSYTSDSSATATEIIAGLKTAIDALSLGVTVSDQTTYMRILVNTAGVFHSVSVDNSQRLGLAQDHADPGYAADLAAIALEQNAWYALLNPFNSKAVVQAIATWAESNNKLFIAQTQDSDVVNISSASDTTTIAHALQGADFRTSLWYQPNTSDFLDAAIAGCCLPLDPGSETWALQSPAGVSVVPLTATQRLNALAKYVNVFETVAGIPLTNNGTVSGNEYIDVIRFRDWLVANLAADILDALANKKKVPFTDVGISVIAGKVRMRLKLGVAAGGLSPDPAPVVIVPRASDVSPSDKALRKLTGVKFDAILAGAIQAVSISGVISV